MLINLPVGNPEYMDLNVKGWLKYEKEELQRELKSVSYIECGNLPKIRLEKSTKNNKHKRV